MSNATDPNASKVPGTVQDKAPEGLERNLPESIHPTGDSANKGSHAVDPKKGSIVPEKIQEKVPEKLERALPNAIHDTGAQDKKT